MENVDMITILIALLVMFVAIMAGIAAILKHQFKLQNELSGIKERLTKVEMVLDISRKDTSKDYKYTNERIDDTNKIVAQIDANYQLLISKLIDVINNPKTITQKN